MKQTELTGFVISRKNINDADKIVGIFTRELGKQSFIAKGIRKPQAKLQSQIEPLVESKYRILGNGKLPALVGAKGLTKNEFYGKSVDINVAGLLLTEIVEKFSVEGMPNEAAYKSYRDGLENISRGDKTRLIITYFVLQLMKAFGIEPHIESGHNKFWLDIENGTINGLGGNDSLSINADTVKLWNACIKYDISTVVRLKIGTKTLVDSLNMLLTYVQYHSERKIKSTKVLSESTNLLQAG